MKVKTRHIMGLTFLILCLSVEAKTKKVSDEREGSAGNAYIGEVELARQGEKK